MLVISEHLHLYPEQGHQHYHRDRPQDVPLILTILPLQLCKTVIVWNPVIFVIMNPMVKLFRGRCIEKKGKKTSVSFMFVCVAENAELLVFCTFPIGNFLS